MQKKEMERITSIASLNIATSSRDEKNAPLHNRLPFIEQLLSNPWFDILCVQEVRGSGPFTAFDILMTLRLFLGQHWEFYDQTSNCSKNSFHQAIFWNTKHWRHHHSEVWYVPHQPLSAHTLAMFSHPNQNSPIHFHLITKSWFTAIQSIHNIPSFCVINTHAPTSRFERIVYWKQVRSLMEPTAILVGDLNKFESERTLFDRIFCKPYRDFIPPDLETFVSFDHDRKPEGDLWRSSLDSVVVDTTYLQAKVEIVSTEKEPRPTDHFFIVAQIFWNS